MPESKVCEGCRLLAGLMLEYDTFEHFCEKSRGILINLRDNKCQP